MNCEEKIVITFMNGPADGRSVTVEGKTVSIGKCRGNDVVIDFDPMVEERHMELVRHQDRWKFLDKSSKAGVYLDGVRINESGLLNRESLVEIGNTLLNFRVER